MSIFKLPLKDFADIATTLRNQFADNFLSPREVVYATYFMGSPEMPEYKKHAINYWAERLYIANYLAYEYQYGENTTITIQRLEEKDLSGNLIPERALAEKLRLLRYNLYTNAGKSFVSEEDLTKLSRLIEYITFLLLGSSKCPPNDATEANSGHR